MAERQAAIPLLLFPPTFPKLCRPHHQKAGVGASCPVGKTLRLPEVGLKQEAALGECPKGPIAIARNGF